MTDKGHNYISFYFMSPPVRNLIENHWVNALTDGLDASPVYVHAHRLGKVFASVKLLVCKRVSFRMQCAFIKFGAVYVGYNWIDKCMFIQLSITYNNKLIVNVFWRQVSALRSRHHRATTQEQKSRKLCKSWIEISIHDIPFRVSWN